MRESFDSLFVGFPLAVFGIFVIVATVFRSYAQPFVILFTIPFGIIGAVFGHLLLGYDLSIMSIFGMVALTGVVVNDAIVLIERINENLSEGMTFRDAIVQGGCVGSGPSCSPPCPPSEGWHPSFSKPTFRPKS